MKSSAQLRFIASVGLIPAGFPLPTPSLGLWGCGWGCREGLGCTGATRNQLPQDQLPEERGLW